MRNRPDARPATRQDARLGQAAAQCILLVLVLGLVDFGPSVGQIIVILLTTLAMEALRCFPPWVTRMSCCNWKSALPTALSLCLLLRTHDPLIWLAAPIIAMGSKYWLRIGGKHVFNPSAFALVALLLAAPGVWVSPGQWGAHLWLAALIGLMGGMILLSVARLDIALSFLVAHLVLLLARAWWLGDPLAIPLHQMQSGSLLIFALFMLTDPRSTPDSRAGRLVFAAAVAAVAHVMLFHFQLREGLLYALILVSCVTPLLDRALPGPRFDWSSPKESFS